MSDRVDELEAAYQAANVRLQRAELGRFLIACGMVLTVIGEFLGVVFLSSSRLEGGMPWWLIGTFILEAVMLNIATRGVNQIRTITFDLWKQYFDAMFAAATRGSQ